MVRAIIKGVVIGTCVFVGANACAVIVGVVVALPMPEPPDQFGGPDYGWSCPDMTAPGDPHADPDTGRVTV